MMDNPTNSRLHRLLSPFTLFLPSYQQLYSMYERIISQPSSSKDAIPSQSTSKKKLSEKAKGKQKMVTVPSKQDMSDKARGIKRMVESSSKQQITPPSTKKTSPYNMFMKNEYDKIKKSNPGINHKRAFNMAAANWTKSATNPKNKNKNKKTSSSHPVSSKLTLG